MSSSICVVHAKKVIREVEEICVCIVRRRPPPNPGHTHSMVLVCRARARAGAASSGLMYVCVIGDEVAHTTSTTIRIINVCCFTSTLGQSRSALACVALFVLVLLCPSSFSECGQLKHQTLNNGRKYNGLNSVCKCSIYYNWTRKRKNKNTGNNNNK